MWRLIAELKKAGADPEDLEEVRDLVADLMGEDFELETIEEEG